MVVFRYHPLRYCKIQRLTLLFLAHKSRPLNLPDRRQRSRLDFRRSLESGLCSSPRRTAVLSGGERGLISRTVAAGNRAYQRSFLAKIGALYWGKGLR